jgi:hypothetical protein
MSSFIRGCVYDALLNKHSNRLRVIFDELMCAKIECIDLPSFHITLELTELICINRLSAKVAFPYTIRRAFGVVPSLSAPLFSGIDARLMNKNLLRIDHVHNLPFWIEINVPALIDAFESTCDID